MLNRLGVGLVNEGVRVVSVVPEGDDERGGMPAMIPQVRTPMPAPLLLRRRATDALVDAIGRHDVDTLVAFGAAAASVSARVASRLDADLLVEVVSIADAQRLRRNASVDAYLAATPSIERAIIERLGPGRATHVPIAAAGSAPPEAPETETCLAIGVLDAAVNPAATRAFLAALAAVDGDGAARVFLELRGRGQHRAWRAVRDCGLLDRVTCIRDASPLRSLVIDCDLIVLPGTRHGVRSILLEAMQHRRAVLAAAIEGLDMLVGGETSMLVEDDWEAPLDRLLGDAGLRSRLGNAASSLVCSQYGSATQVQALAALLERL